MDNSIQLLENLSILDNSLVEIAVFSYDEEQLLMAFKLDADVEIDGIMMMISQILDVHVTNLCYISKYKYLRHFDALELVSDIAEDGKLEIYVCAVDSSLMAPAA